MWDSFLLPAVVRMGSGTQIAGHYLGCSCLPGIWHRACLQRSLGVLSLKPVSSARQQEGGPSRCSLSLALLVQVDTWVFWSRFLLPSVLGSLVSLESGLSRGKGKGRAYIQGDLVYRPQAQAIYLVGLLPFL